MDLLIKVLGQRQGICMSKLTEYIRNKIRYYRCYREIKTLENKYNCVEFDVFDHHLGETYLLGAMGVLYDRPVIVFYAAAKELLEMLGVRAEVGSARLHRLIANGIWGNDLKVYSKAENWQDKNHVEVACEYFSVNKPNEWAEITIPNEYIINAKAKLKKWKDRSVLITPDAQIFSVDALDEIFWINLADILKKNGYEVIFNSKKKYGNYESVFLQLGETIYCVRNFDAVIGLRSGLHDVLAGTTNTKIFSIYPRETDRIQEGIIVSIERWSLRSMRNEENVKEIVFDGDTASLMEKVMKFIK